MHRTVMGSEKVVIFGMLPEHVSECVFKPLVCAVANRTVCLSAKRPMWSGTEICTAVL